MTEAGSAKESPAIRALLKHPESIGKAVGFKDLTKMHGEWIRRMVYGKGDYTLQPTGDPTSPPAWRWRSP